MAGSYAADPTALLPKALSYYNGSGDPRSGNPDTFLDFYNFMRGRWRDGSPITVGGNGLDLDAAPVTTIVYPNSGTLADPVPGYWSEVCPQPGCGAPVEPDDRRFHTSTGPFTMQPGETVTVAFALVWARGASNFDSVQELKVASDFVERAYSLGALDPVAPPPLAAPEPPDDLRLAGPFPNPFRDAAALTLTVPEGLGRLRVAVYDVLGREVAVLADGVLAPGEHPLVLDGSGLAAGVYLVRLETGGGAKTLKLIHTE